MFVDLALMGRIALELVLDRPAIAGRPFVKADMQASASAFVDDAIDRQGRGADLRVTPPAQKFRDVTLLVMNRVWHRASRPEFR